MRERRRLKERTSGRPYLPIEVEAGSAPEPMPVAASSTLYVWYVILLLAVVNLFNMMDRMALAVLAPYIKTDLHFSDAQLGLLTGFAFAAFYAVCGVPIARWADRGVRRNIIALALTTWSLMTALAGAAQSFWQLLVARMGVGAGEAGSYSPGASILCDYVPLQRRPGVFAIHTFGLVAGMMLGMALAGWMGERIGWRWTFVALGLPGVALAVVVRLTLREPRRGGLDAATDQPELSFAKTVVCLWRCRTYRALMLFLVVNGFVQDGLNQWRPSFYSRVFGLDLATVGVYLGIAIGVGMGVGLLIGGIVGNNKSARRDVRLPLRICAATTLLALPTSLGSLFVPSAVDSMLLVGLTGLFWGVASGPVIATAFSATAPHMRATAGALLTFVTAVLGIGLGPLCVGVLSDMLLPVLGHESLRYAMLAPTCLLPVMVMALLVAAKALPHDLAGAAQHERPAATAVKLAIAK